MEVKIESDKNTLDTQTQIKPDIWVNIGKQLFLHTHIEGLQVQETDILLDHTERYIYTQQNRAINKLYIASVR